MTNLLKWCNNVIPERRYGVCVFRAHFEHITSARRVEDTRTRTPASRHRNLRQLRTLTRSHIKLFFYIPRSTYLFHSSLYNATHRLNARTVKTASIHQLLLEVTALTWISAEPASHTEGGLTETAVFSSSLAFCSISPSMADPTSPPETPLRSPDAPLTVSFPFLREGSRVWEERGEQALPRELPSPLPTKRTRTYSATVRAHSGPVFKGVCKNFSRSQGHGFIRPSHGGEDIFVHISDIDGEYVPVEGDEVTYKVCRVPPKNLKVQAVEVKIIHLNPGTKHETWSGQIISS
ncbi:cold shock domain-containing protein C2 isoform X1 [Dunckerocampus dactyliophorus]|uniref:cold shock domain-containing protein C2 isoform X1 n=2 Tax=Dunckerocampus dactyliophorus TaxID=161453 RepID=UPI0024051C42|nr:cold shock domain-containing protein C2 isoform X1 [Dunckerocampus dactyliophorus]